MEGFFPIKLLAYDTPGYTDSSMDFRLIFQKAKPEGLTWYAYDTIVKSPTLVEFVVYDLASNYMRAEGGSGRIGREIGRFEVKVSKKDTKKTMQNRALRLAEQQRHDELVAQEQQIIGSYAYKILKEAHNV